MTRLGSWWRLPPPERVLAARAVVLLASVALALRWLGYAAVRRWLDRTRPSGGPLEASRVRVAMQRASRTLPRVRCLAQACAAERLLRAGGAPAVLTIGVAPTRGGTLDAHAWVESGGLLVAGDGPLARYTPVSRTG